MTRETSVEAFHAVVEDGRVDTQRERLLRAAMATPGTARDLGERAGIPEHDATTRCALLKREGLLRELGTVVSERTGRRAILLAATEAGRECIATGQRPAARPTRRGLERDVVEAARFIASRPGSLTALARLQDALNRLDAS